MQSVFEISVKLFRL